MLLRSEVNQAGPLTRAGIILTATALGAVWLAFSNAETTGEVVARMADRGPFGYMLTAFPVLGILLADLAALFRQEGYSSRTLELAAQVGLQGLIAVLRLAILIPVSGHVLLMAYTLLRRRWTPVPDRGYPGAGLETLLIAGLLGWVSFVKLFLWGDPVTWLSGMTLAIGLAWISARFYR